METLCHTLLTMTLTSTVAALVVMALRLVLRGTPRTYIYILWIMVILRMLCPFELLPGPVSLIPESVTSGRAAEVILDRNWTAPTQTTQEPEPTFQNVEAPAQAPAPVQETPPPTVTPYQVIGGIWIAGLAGMLLWTAVSYGKIRRRVAEAVMAEADVYESDRIDTPFVLGRSIYLPAGLPEPDRRYVLLHEQVHVKQWDPLWKALGWLALAVHWFNPVLWLAYRLLCRDIETVCDQHVLEGFAPETRLEDTAGYAAALLHLGRREGLPQTVLPFGEENAKGRIKDVLKYRRPAKWVTVVTSALFAVVFLGLIWNPQAMTGTVEIQGREVYFADAEWADAETDEMYTVTLTTELLRELAKILEDAPSRTYQSQEAVEEDPALAGWNGRYEPLAGEIPQLTFWCEHDVVCVLSGWGNGTVLWADGAGDTYVLYPDVKDSKKFREWEVKFEALIEQTKTPVISHDGDASDGATDQDLILDGRPTLEQFTEWNVERFEGMKEPQTTESVETEISPETTSPEAVEESVPAAAALPMLPPAETPASPAGPVKKPSTAAGTPAPIPDPAAQLLGKATTVRRAGPGRNPGDEVRDLFFSAGAGRYLNKDNALMYIQNNEVKVLLTEDTDADARELTRAANLTLALTDGSDTFRVYDKDGNAVVDTYGDQGVLAEEDFRAMYQTETGEPRPAPPPPEEPEAAPALPEGFTMTPEPPPPPDREMPDSMNFDFTQTDQPTTNEGVE